MIETIFFKRLLVFICFVVLYSCENTFANVDFEVEDSTCELLSFALLKANNPVLESDIVFDRVSINGTFTAHCLNWNDGLKPHMGLVPTFTIDGTSLILDGEEIISDSSPVDFSSDRTFVVKSNNKEKSFRVSFVCPQINSELPVIRIIASADTIGKEDYVSTKAILYNTDTGEYEWNESTGDVRIRGRGNSTWLLPKKPYRIKFSSKVSPFGMNHAKAKDWVILAHDMDKSLLRNHLAFTVAGALINEKEYQDRPYSAFSPKSKFINLFFDKAYWGVYQLTDQIEKGEGRVDIESLGVKQGDDPSIISGGHMLEMVYKVDDWLINFRTPSGIRIDHKYPKKDDHTEAQWRYIEDFVTDAENVLYGDSFRDDNEGWRKYFDEHTLVDWIIVKEFVGDMDGYIGTRLFKNRQYEKLCFGPVWDMDKAWGNDVRTPFIDYPPSSSLMIYGGFRTPGNSIHDWFMRFWEDEKLRDAVNNRWKAKRDELVDMVFQQIDEKKESMRKSILANYMVWPYDVQNCKDASQPQATYDDELELIKLLTLERAKLLDKLFGVSEENPTTHVNSLMSRPLFMQSTGNVITITGTKEGEQITVYSVDGVVAKNVKASNDVTVIQAGFKKGDIVIVKVGDKSEKIVIQ